MRIKFSFSVLILLFSFGLFANEYSPGSEIGNAVFRPLSVYDPGGQGWCMIGHTALYRCSNGNRDWSPDTSMKNSDLTQSVIQATGEGTVVGWHTFQFFLGGYQADGWGYTSSNRPNTVTRLKLIKDAKEQYGAKYPKLRANPDENEWYYPKIMTPNSSPGSGDGCFRCDGLVEYVYEQENMGFFSEDEKYHCWFRDSLGHWIGFPIFYPQALRERMTDEGCYPPYLEMVEPQNGDTIENVVPIVVNTYDRPQGIGSGIDRVDIFIDRNLMYRDDEDCDGVKEVNYTWDTNGVNAGLHRITVKSYDRAGNMAEKEILVYKGHAPWVIWTTPADGATDIEVDKDKVDVFIVFSKAMDRVSTEGAISISPSVPFHFIWNADNKGITMKFNDHLNYCEEYIVTVSDDAKSEDGIKLDGNGDGGYNREIVKREA